jgi:hypothetical protein
MYRGNHSLVKAAAMMCVEQAERKVNNRLYEWLRILLRESQSLSQRGALNSQWKTKWICCDESKIGRKVPYDDDVPTGWRLGRYRRSNAKETKTSKLPSKRQEKYKIAQAEAQMLYDQYISSGYTSIRKFCRNGEYNYSHVSLTNKWKKYIIEYRLNVKHGKRFDPRWRNGKRT